MTWPPGPTVRVVADTNTVVSAFLWSGAPADILIAAREQPCAFGSVS